MQRKPTSNTKPTMRKNATASKVKERDYVYVLK